MPKGKGPRHCAKCGQVGHYAKTCKIVVNNETQVLEDGAKVKVQYTTSLPEYTGPLKPVSLGAPLKSIADSINKAMESVPEIVKNYTEAINKEKYPHLYAASERGAALKEKELQGWRRVAELRREGKSSSADRLANKLLGVEPKVKMTEEQKQELKAHYEENKEEILKRRKEKREQEKLYNEAVERQSKKVRIRRKK